MRKLIMIIFFLLLPNQVLALTTYNITTGVHKHTNRYLMVFYMPDCSHCENFLNDIKYSITLNSDLKNYTVILLNSKNADDLKIFKALNINNVPTFFITDSKFKTIYKHSGQLTGFQLHKIFTKLK